MCREEKHTGVDRLGIAVSQLSLTCKRKIKMFKRKEALKGLKGDFSLVKFQSYSFWLSVTHKHAQKFRL